jgi:hypothetical protein
MRLIVQRCITFILHLPKRDLSRYIPVGFEFMHLVHATDASSLDDTLVGSLWRVPATATSSLDIPPASLENRRDTCARHHP